MHRFLGFPRPLASWWAPFLSSHGGSYMLITKTVTQGQREVCPSGARASTVRLPPGGSCGHALRITVREVQAYDQAAS